MPAKRVAIEIDYGPADPLRLEIGRDALIGDCRGPDGTEGGAAGQIAATALRASAESPLAARGARRPRDGGAGRSRSTG